MDGIINLNKPVRITSAKALYRVRSITRHRKSGHAGTLDPGASGVLVLCLGKATRLVEAVMEQPKVYRARARLDVISESHDSDSPLEPVAVDRPPDESELRAALASFVGRIEQVPPLISAVKVGGQAAYRHAAAGRPIALAPRAVHVHALDLHAYDYPHLEFELMCGRGTYVRALIRDLGKRLGTGGCLTSLVRTRVGPFGIADAWTFDALRTAEPAEYLIPLERARQWLAAVPTEGGSEGDRSL